MSKFAEATGNSVGVSFSLEEDNEEVDYKLQTAEEAPDDWVVDAYINGKKVGQADIDTIVREIQNGRIGQSEV